MQDFFAAILSYPTVVFTVLLGSCIAYWLLVIVGALGIDVLDVDLDGADGAAEGATEGATEGLDGGVLSSLLSLLHLRNVPVTLVLSMVVFWSWVLCAAAAHYVMPALSIASPFVVGSGLLLGSMVVALPLASVSVRPLGRLLEPERQTSRSDLIGKVVVVTTGRVDAKFGMADAPGEDGPSMRIHVRCDNIENHLTRGSKVLVLGYDESRRAYEVSPVDDMLPSAATDG